MNQSARGEITRILERLGGAESGTDGAMERLFEAAYTELRLLAARSMRDEQQNQTLQPTALVHEAYLRLVGGQPIAWQSRAHFFGVAARAMRQILVERARRRKAEIHGGGTTRVELDESIPATLFDEMELLALEDALNRLAERDARLAQVVELRIFGGMSVPAVAHVLKVCERTVHEDWRFARMWLARELSEDQER